MVTCEGLGWWVPSRDGCFLPPPPSDLSLILLLFQNGKKSLQCDLTILGSLLSAGILRTNAAYESIIIIVIYTYRVDTLSVIIAITILNL